MKKMDYSVLQPILFPIAGIGDSRLYYRYSGQGVRCFDEQLTIAPETDVDLSTYFNSFSVCKWREYTGIGQYSLLLKLKGPGCVKLYHYCLDGGTVRQSLLSERQIAFSEWDELILKLPEIEEGVIGFSICSKEDVLYMKEAAYCTDEMCEAEEVRLALAFTTYRREAYISENVNSILRLKDPGIHIFISDNASTLNLPDDPQVSVFRNINSGGAGGFSRGMLEIIRSRKSFSHVVLMDDDVTIDPRVFDRLMRFLSYIKPEYKDAFVGGAMFRRDHGYFHVESGAKRKGIVVYPYGYGLDMRRIDAMLHTDTFHDEEYNAWWFCCIPISYIREDNLPLPVFFQWDDIDYGIRNNAPLILMNGICLWHDAFDTKRTAMHTYYSNRNPLIVNCCHGEGASERRVLKELKKKVCTEICLYRYEHAEALIQAMEDFLRGPEWLCSLDPEEYNKKILALNRQVSYVADKVDFEWYLVGCGISDCDALHALVRILTMNGYLLKANREHTLPLYADRSVQGYRAKRLLFYEVNTGTGYYTEKDIKKAFLCMMKFHKLYFRMWFRYPSVAKKYRDSYAYMTSKKMWEKYLKLQGEYSG
ncbi:MAG: glycosyltransferase [Lachnospiraceae bacterium]|nr:glycosyltransferase [Lachnospiraceae bacterium]